jgi:hypothetical protein
MRIKILVQTPRNQAAKCINTQKSMLLGYSRINNVVKQELLNDHSFLWYVEVKDLAEYTKIAKRCATAEVFIRRFYQFLFRMVDRVNWLAKKFDKGAAWAKGWLVQRLKKQYRSTEGENDMIRQIEEMNDSEFLDFIQVSDRIAMEKFLKGDLITVEDAPEEEDSL